MSKDKVAVVTGSTSGIGLGIARALAAGGADLMINGFGDAAPIEKLRQEIANDHRSARACRRGDRIGSVLGGGAVVRGQTDLTGKDLFVVQK